MTDAFTRINMCGEALEQTKENLRIMTDRYEWIWKHCPPF